MVWVTLYLIVGFSVALAMFFALHSEKKLADVPLASAVVVFLFVIIVWPAFAIYRYCL